jgi:DNA mismatch repair protein MutS
VIPASASPVAAYSYKIFHSHDFSLVKYSVRHCFDFIKGMGLLVEMFAGKDIPLPLKKQLDEAKKILEHPVLKVTGSYKFASDMKITEILVLGYFIRYKFKNNVLELLNIFGKLDAWYGMAMAIIKFDLAMPAFTEADGPVVNAKGLYHLMVDKAVPYDVVMNRQTNFLFLTGANMAGKSTFIKACGTAVYLAHTGMGVPAKEMQLTYFDGILSNINVIDNIAKGESYFFNEVQRIKATISKVSDGRKWLVLIDELFKGTNVQDAMKCSSAVIEGLLKISNSLFILSTHLYEIGDELKKHPNITFNYFETAVTNDQLSFSYQLKEGISNDKLGYLILKKEGVVNMLENL